MFTGTILGRTGTVVFTLSGGYDAASNVVEAKYTVLSVTAT